MSIWITRSSPDNLTTAERLDARGRRSLLVPVLTAVARPAAPLSMTPDAMLFSSKHSVRHHRLPADHANIPVYAAGEAVAQAARAMGYRDVTWSGGDDRTLCDFMRHLLPEGAIVAHLCSDRTSLYVDERLSSHGFTVERQAVYETRTVDISGVAAARAALNEIEGVLVHSTAAARTVRIVLAGTRWRGTVWCISHTSAAVLQGLDGVRVVVARQPTEASLLGLVLRETEAASTCPAPRSRIKPANDN